MKKALTTLALSSLLLASCSTFNPMTSEWKRSLASDPESPLTLDELLSFKASHVYDSGNYIPDQKFYLNNVLASANIDMKFIMDPNMGAEESFKLVPSMEKDKYLITVYHAPKATHDKIALNELVKFIEKVDKSFSSPYSLFEIYYNAKKGDFTGHLALAKLRYQAVTQFGSWETPDMISTESKSYWTVMNEKFTEQEIEFTNQKKTKMHIASATEELARNEQLKSLIAKNDRQGAVKLIRSYLQWDEMSSFEKEFWDNSLKVMADPVPLEERVLVYRVTGTDGYNPGLINGNPAKLDAAVKQQNAFIMAHTFNITDEEEKPNGINALSNLLTDKESGQFAYYNVEEEEALKKNAMNKYARVSNLFDKRTPGWMESGPFLRMEETFITNPYIKTSRSAAYLVDPRLIYLQRISPMKYLKVNSSSSSFIMPLFTFPDDMGGVYLNQNPYKVVKEEEFLDQMLVRRLDLALGSGEGSEALKKIKERSKKLLNPSVVKYDRDTRNIATILLDQKFTKTFKSELPEPVALKPGKVQADLNCTGIVNLIMESN